MIQLIASEFIKFSEWKCDFLHNLFYIYLNVNDSQIRNLLNKIFRTAGVLKKIRHKVNVPVSSRCTY